MADETVFVGEETPWSVEREKLDEGVMSGGEMGFVGKSLLEADNR